MRNVLQLSPQCMSATFDESCMTKFDYRSEMQKKKIVPIHVVSLGNVAFKFDFRCDV